MESSMHLGKAVQPLHFRQKLKIRQGCTGTMNEPVPNQAQLLTFCEFPGSVSVQGRLLLLHPQVLRTRNLCILVRFSNSHGDAVRLARDDRLAGFLDLL